CSAEHEGSSQKRRARASALHRSTRPLSAVAFAFVTRARAALLLPLIALGCAEPRTTVELLDAHCASDDSPVRVRVLSLRGDGLSPRTLVLGAEGNPGEVSLVVPPGAHRTLELRAYDGDPNGNGRLLALGHTQPFDVAPGEGPSLRLVVRP